jgi:hypothetical protein
MKYLIVLFKNKERKKIIKKFKTHQRAKEFFDNQIKNNKVVFEKGVENGKSCSFEIGLLERDSTNFDSYFIKDSLGRQIKVDIDDPDYKVLQISNYSVEEFIYDISKNKKISIDKFISEYLKRGSIKLISKLNNKIVVQDDDKFSLFSLKSDDDCFRFTQVLQKYLAEKNRIDCIIVLDSSLPQKKYLYSLLESRGISKSILYKKSTTFFTGE